MRPTTAASVTARPSPGGTAAKNALERQGDLLGEPGRPVGGGQARWPPGDRGFSALSHRRNRRAAVPAFHLAKPADQVHAAALAALVQVGGPVAGCLAAGADQHLPVALDPAAPRAVPAYRIHLPCTAAIAGHLVLLPRAGRARAGSTQRGQSLLILGDVARLRRRVDHLPADHAILID